jgi:alpha-mannosidase
VLPHQVLGVTQAHERLDSPHDYPDQDRVWAVRVAVAAPRVPAFGLTRLAVREREASVAVREGVTATPKGLRAPWGGVRADAAGFTVRAGTRSLRLAPLLTSERDEGDTYTIEPVSGDRPLAARWGKAIVVWEGPLVAALGRPFRIGQRVRGTVFMRVDAGSPLVRVVVEGENLAGQHRLRMHVPVGAGGRATADMPYGAVTRPLVRFAPDGFRSEWPVTTAPMHRWVGAGGWTVCARGLHEYELLPDGTIAVTLLRAVGDLSRGSLRARPGHAGWPTPTPGAQGLGRFRVELALAPVGVEESAGPRAWDAVERVVEEFHAPLAGRMYRTGVDVPGEVAGPALEGRGLAFRALKPREDGPGVVLRCVNLTRRARQGAWTFPSPVTRAFRARLDETLEAELALSADRCRMEFRAGPRETVTVVVER